MKDVATGGRTVLFVSHNMAVIQNLCDRTLLIESGQIVKDGRTSDVVSHYLSGNVKSNQQSHLARFSKPRGINQIVYFRIDTSRQHNVINLQSGTDVELVFGCQGNNANKDLLLSWVIQNSMGQQLLLQHNKIEGTKLQTAEGLSEIVCRIPRLPLPAGDYRVYAQLWIDGDLVDETNTEMFSVEVGNFFDTGLTIEAQNALFLIRATWSQRPPINKGNETKKDIN